MSALDRHDSDEFDDTDNGPFSISHSHSHSSHARASIPVPLPTEIPPPPDLSRLPAHILHSGTVETLIGQNEDLMARLKVNIRRNSILESQIMEHDRVVSEMTRVNASILSQLQVLQEKDRIWRGKTSAIDEKQDAMKNRIQFLETKMQATLERNEELRAGLSFEHGFRRRVQKWVRPLVDRLKHQLVAERERIKTLEQNTLTRDATISDLRDRLQEAVLHIQSQEAFHSKDQAQLVGRYESKIKSLESDLTKTRTELKLTRDKAERMDAAVAAKAEFENRIIYLERLVQDNETKTAQYRKESKTLAVERLDYERRLGEATTELSSLRESYSQLQDQFESLQAVWTDAQKKSETSRLQQDSLNKLNQELSRQLKEERRIRDAQQKETVLRTALTVPGTPSARRSSNPEVSAVGTARETAHSGTRLEKIDNLLAELESGFVKPRSTEVAQMRALDIIDAESNEKSSESPNERPRKTEAQI